MRLRDIESFVKQQLAGGGASGGSGGGVPDYTQRVGRQTYDNGFGPNGGNDQPVLDMLATPGTFIDTKFTDKAVLVELSTRLNSAGGFAATATPSIRKADGTGQQDFHPASFQLANGAQVSDGGQSQVPLSFIVPAGWRYTIALAGDVNSGTAASIDTIHETPLA